VFDWSDTWRLDLLQMDGRTDRWSGSGTVGNKHLIFVFSFFGTLKPHFG
jgi:hypothetical protein